MNPRTRFIVTLADNRRRSVTTYADGDRWHTRNEMGGYPSPRIAVMAHALAVGWEVVEIRSEHQRESTAEARSWKHGYAMAVLIGQAHYPNHDVGARVLSEAFGSVAEIKRLPLDDYDREKLAPCLALMDERAQNRKVA